MQFLRSVCYNSFQVPHCLIRFFTNRPKSVILFYSEVFFSQPSFSEFLIFELYKKLLYIISCGWRTYTYYLTGVFLLEAKAIWEHTCITGGLLVFFVPFFESTKNGTKKTGPCPNKKSRKLFI